MIGTRLYALLLVASVGGAVAGEFIPRGHHARLTGKKLDEQFAKHAATLASMKERGAREQMVEGDAEVLIAVEKDVVALERERKIRVAQAGAFAGAALGSVLFFALALPGTLRARGARKRATVSGQVEICADERKTIDEYDLRREELHLYATRELAIANLRSQGRMQCSYCATPVPMPVLGRIGRRVLLKRPPAGAADIGVELGTGWFSMPANPPPCPKCGNTNVVAA